MGFDAVFHVLWVTTYDPTGWAIGGALLFVLGAGLLARSLMRVW